MYSNKKIGVVVPAHNEERFIAGVIDSMPEFVDRIYVVDDGSTDRTPGIVCERARRDSRVAMVNRQARGGVGAAVLSGHATGLREGMEVLAVMAGDGQMDPAFLKTIISPVAEGKAEYAKGNRLARREDRKEMPAGRLWGNVMLTTLTRVASGYWNISDPQNGYTAISAATLKKLDMRKIERGYAFENDMLVRLKAVDARVVEVRHPAVYRGQNSKIRYFRFIFRTSWILLKGYAWRIWKKHSGRKLRPLAEQMPEHSRPLVKGGD